MVIDWFKFSAAFLLLLTPIGLFHGPGIRYRRVSRDWSTHLPQVWSLGLHAIDLGRAVLGAWLLSEAARRVPGVTGVMRQAPLLLHAAMFGLAVVLQMLVCKEPHCAHAPFAFVIGLVAGYLPPTVAGFALVFAIALAAGARLPQAFFPLVALSVAAAGFLFHGKKMLPTIGVMAGAAILPALITLLFYRPMVISYRSKRNPGNSAPPSPAASR